MTSFRLAAVLVALSSVPGVTTAQPQPQNVKSAIDVIVLFCVAGGEKYSLVTTGDASAGLALKKLGANASAQITITKSEARGLVDGLNASLSTLSAQQASEARKCMQPYIDRVIDLLLPKSPGPASSGRLEIDSLGVRLAMPRAEFQKLTAGRDISWGNDTSGYYAKYEPSLFQHPVVAKYYFRSDQLSSISYSVHHSFSRGVTMVRYEADRPENLVNNQTLGQMRSSCSALDSIHSTALGALGEPIEPSKVRQVDYRDAEDARCHTGVTCDRSVARNTGVRTTSKFRLPGANVLSMTTEQYTTGFLRIVNSDRKTSYSFEGCWLEAKIADA